MTPEHDTTDTAALEARVDELERMRNYIDGRLDALHTQLAAADHDASGTPHDTLLSALDAESAISLDLLLDRAEDAGHTRGDARAALDDLFRRGEAYTPTEGTVKRA